MQIELTKKQLKKQSRFNFFKKPKYSDEDYREMGFWICTMSATLSLSLIALLAGLSFHSVFIVICSAYGVLFGMKATLLIRCSTPYDNHLKKSTKWFILSMILLLVSKLI